MAWTFSNPVDQASLKPAPLYFMSLSDDDFPADLLGSDPEHPVIRSELLVSFIK